MGTDTLGTLKKLLKTFLLSDIKPLDIWDVEMKCYDEGGIYKVTSRNGVRKVLPVKEINPDTGEEANVTLFHRKMSNYCSIGVDAKIGYLFDMNRT